HMWTFFVMTDPEHLDAALIDCVVVHLHKTFDPPSTRLTTPPFELTRVGWGTFTITCEIYWKNGIQAPTNPTTVNWPLNFKGGGSQQHIDVLLQIPRIDNSNNEDSAEQYRLRTTLDALLAECVVRSTEYGQPICNDVRWGGSSSADLERFSGRSSA
ncbi:hypothetical protein GGF31_000551, partial [Allomyces arbusculus]